MAVALPTVALLVGTERRSAYAEMPRQRGHMQRHVYVRIIFHSFNSYFCLSVSLSGWAVGSLRALFRRQADWYGTCIDGSMQLTSAEYRWLGGAAPSSMPLPGRLWSLTPPPPCLAESG